MANGFAGHCNSMLSVFGCVSTDTTHRRRAVLGLLMAACVVATAARAGAQQFPYSAYVNAPDVYLRSGPGENYYPVGKLDHGERIEIYRHDPGGWYAMRPPAGSFSWVSAEFIEPRQGNIGVVTGDRVVARVGSSFSETRDVIQVRLDRGEEVEILEAHEFNSGPAAQTWYKIAPPAGEFRWISGRYVDRELAEPESRQPSPENNLLIARQNRHRTRNAIDRETDRRHQHGRQRDEDQRTDDEPSDEWEEVDDGDGVRQAVHEEPAPRPRRPAKTHTTQKHKTGDDEDDEADEDAPDVDDGRRARLKPEQRRIKANLKEEAEDLDLALSAMVVEEPTAWDFTVLRQQAENALNRADTALDRGRIRRVLRKIDNFADIQQRHLAVMDGRRNGSPEALATNGLNRPSGGLSPPRYESLRYDGVGRLTQLTTLDPRLPQFALVDARGQVAAYVSPAPGVNLRRYLNQEVGINGTLGYLPERQAQHLTAKRIVPVEANSLR